MKRSRHAITTIGIVCTLTPFACSSERIDVDVTYLSEISTATPANNTRLDIIFAPDASFLSRARELYIRVDGKLLLSSPENPRIVTLLPEGNYGPRVDNLVFSSHVFQVVEESGEARVTTSPLNLTPGRNNTLLIYGSDNSFDYVFFANSDAELASVPEDMVAARLINVMADHPTFPLRTCPASAGPASSINLADCTVVDASFGYGKLWQGIVPRATNLAIPCDVTAPDVLCHLWNLGPSCTVGSTQVPVRATLYALTRRPGGVFASHDVLPEAGCPMLTPVGE